MPKISKGKTNGSNRNLNPLFLSVFATVTASTMIASVAGDFAAFLKVFAAHDSVEYAITHSDASIVLVSPLFP